MFVNLLKLCWLEMGFVAYSMLWWPLQNGIQELNIIVSLSSQQVKFIHSHYPLAVIQVNSPFCPLSADYQPHLDTRSNKTMSQTERKWKTGEGQPLEVQPLQ